MPKHPLHAGTWFASSVAVIDDGEHNERCASAGAVGRIDGHGVPQRRRAGWRYEVTFDPSGIRNFWDDAEIDAGGEILEAGDRRSPIAEQCRLAEAVASIYDEPETDGETILLDLETVSGIVVVFRATGSEDAVLAETLVIGLPVTEGKLAMPLSTADRIAGLAGVADRLASESEKPPAP